MLEQASSTNPTFKLVLLKQLMLSPENVATTGRDKVSDLVASIAAIGLQQNLVVAPAAGSDCYFVKAGGRRLRALQVLSETGEWPEDREIPVAVIPEGASPREVSLAENLIRRDMHPADECAAFQKLIEQDGFTTADLAAHFGVTERYVEQRLKLAKVSPKILEEFRRGDGISLGQVMALAITDDQGAQEKAWNYAKAAGEWLQDPDRLRRDLTSQELEVGGSRVATYLGIADYQAGGGVPRLDLFGDEGAGYLPDAKLARSLAKEKLDRYAKEFDAEGWRWKEVRLEIGYNDLDKFAKYGAKDRYSSVDTTKKTWPAAAKQVAGILFGIGHDGEVEIHRGLIRPADAKRAAEAAAAQAKGDKTKSAKPGKRVTADKPLKKPGELSFPQRQVLQAQLTAVVSNEIASNPRVALAALAARLADELDVVSGSELDALVRLGRAHTSSDRLPLNVRSVIEQAPAAKALREKVKAWKTRIPKRTPTVTWLLEQPEAVTYELLALCAAKAFMAVDYSSSQRDTAATFATAAGVDLSDHWTPSADWLAKQPTAYIVQAVTEAHGKQAAAMLVKQQKGKAAVAKKAAELLAPIAPGAKAPWLPKPLRAPEKPAREKKPTTRGKAAAAGDAA